jgi:hypothetical protein
MNPHARRQESALDSILVAFPFGKPVPTFPGNAHRAKARSVFLFGFAKSERENVDDDELETLQDIAKAWLAADAEALARAVQQGLIQEVPYDEEEDQPPDQGAARDRRGHA